MGCPANRKHNVARISCRSQTRAYLRCSTSRYVGLTVAFIASLLLASASVAQNIIGQVNGFTLATWSRSDGLPEAVQSMAQSPDDWIWMASKDQLYRFDGVTAQRYPVSINDGSAIASILATRDGDLWIVHASGQTVHLRSGQFSHPVLATGMKQLVKFLVEDSSGNVWATTTSGLFKEQGEKWQPIYPQPAHAPNVYFDMTMDTKGTLWVLTDEGVLALEKGKSSFSFRDDIDGNQKWKSLKQMDALSLSRNEMLSVLYLPTLLTAHGITVEPSYFSSSWGGLFDSSKGEWLVMPGNVTRLADPTAADLNHLIAGIIQGKPEGQIDAKSMSTAPPNHVHGRPAA